MEYFIKYFVSPHHICHTEEQVRFEENNIVEDKNLFRLFSWRYNPFWFYFHSPVAGFILLVFEVS